MIRTITLIAAITIALAMQATALGITPGITNTAYTPGTEQTIEFTVTNTEDKAIELTLEPLGEITLIPSETTLKLNPHESKTLNYKFTASPALESGTREGSLLIIETPGQNQGIIATAGVITRLKIVVPYEGVEIEADMTTRTSENNKVEFVVAVTNLGTEEIKNLNATISVLNDELLTDNQNLKPGRRTEIKSYWATPTTGRYEAEAIINYDGKTRRLTKEFNAENQEATYQPKEESRTKTLILLAVLAALVLANIYLYIRKKKGNFK